MPHSEARQSLKKLGLIGCLRRGSEWSVLLSLSVEILAGLDGAKRNFFLFRGRLSLLILVEASKSHIAGSVLCASETRIRATRLEFGSFATKRLEFGWIDWEYCFRVEILAGLWMAPSQFVEV